MNTINIPRNMIPKSVVVSVRVDIQHLANIIQHYRSKGNYTITNAAAIANIVAEKSASLDGPLPSVEDSIAIIPKSNCRMGLSAKMALEQEDANQVEPTNSGLDSETENRIASILDKIK